MIKALDVQDKPRPWRPTTCRLRLLSLLISTLLVGCASGSTSSFTQAPLFFSEAIDDSGQFVNTSVASARIGADRLRGGERAAFQGGNTLLPIDSALGAELALGTNGVDVGAAAGGLDLDAQLTTEPGAALSLGAAGRNLTVGAAVPTSVQPANLPVVAAVTAAPAAAVSQVLTTTNNVLGGAAATLPASAATSSLLTDSSTNLVRLCLLKKC